MHTCCASSAGAPWLLDALGGGLREQAVAATRADALLAVSFKQYNADTVRLFAELIARGVRAVSITDTC